MTDTNSWDPRTEYAAYVKWSVDHQEEALSYNRWIEEVLELGKELGVVP